MYGNSTPMLPALKSSWRTEWPHADVGTVPLDTQEVLAILPLPLVLPFYHTCGITHGSDPWFFPSATLVESHMALLSRPPLRWSFYLQSTPPSPAVQVKGRRFRFSPI
ncbi:unnamed protein product [Rangifer tarandus platyrhynchus]|uniref:Uncharacterized protein n=2 Tax=Rangifer tarandus platyrhynchus TaxID=3082113 RepID=A0ABN9A736_RANTA|nr:unnamed protein product [Rangifer tarandus platyrhynchus]